MPSLKARVNLVETNFQELSNKFSLVLGELKAIKWILTIGGGAALIKSLWGAL